jgi:ribonuclease-3
MLSYLKKKGILNSREIKQAFTHKSVNHDHYERLEFLGDSILGAVVSEFLYREVKGTDVGVIAKLKGYLVSKEVLFKIGVINSIASRMHLGSALKLKDVENNKKIISDVVESIVGAIYLLKGFAEAKKFVLTIYETDFEDVKSRKDFGDYKSELQIKVLGETGILPEYKVARTEGKEHSKVFYVDVILNAGLAGQGHGKTIKEAEQMAAQQAIENLLKEEKK